MNAIEFLQTMHPEGPWVLTAINPEQGGERTRTETFYPKTMDGLKAFLNEWNGKWNIYFTVNRIRQPMRKKPERTDIDTLDYLHVDIDPRVGEELEGERERILALLTDKLPEGVPRPTTVVFSGGGYQAFWKLRSPIQLDGTMEKAEDVKLWNMQLERLFNADSCHNIDRIMRLPGTWNVPNAKKRSKGRTKVEAGVVYFDADVAYEMDRFTKAPRIQAGGGRNFDEGGGSSVEVSVNPGNLEQLADVNDLDKFTSDKLPMDNRVKNIIQEGYDPDDTSLDAKPKGDRSVWVFDAVCQMVRRGIPDQVILAVLLDRDYRISDHVYDQKIGAEKYAIRQIKRAKEASIDPTLEELNRQYAVTVVGGKARVLWEDMQELYEKEPRAVVRYMSPDDFRALYCNRVVQAGTKENGEPRFVPLGKWWFEHPNRRQYLGGVHFTPERDFEGKYNLWRGFAVPPIPGKGHETFLAHIKENICSNNEEWYDYFIKWLAHMVQKPSELASVAIVLRGEPGVGKSFVPVNVGMLFGCHFIHVSSSKHLVGNFNAHLEDKIFTFADEAIWSGDKSSQSVLKTLITERTRLIERKGFDAIAMPNYTRLIMASNDEQVIHAQGHERRYFVLTVSSKHRQDKAYFGAIAKELEDGGYSNLLHFLMTVDISGFDPRNYPHTEELQRQKVMSLPSHIEWWLNCLQDGKVHPRHEGWMTDCPKDDAWQAYQLYMQQLRVTHPLSKTGLLKHLREVLPSLTVGQRTVEIIKPTSMDGPEWQPVKVKERAHCYLLPELKTCRALFEERHGPQDWDASA